MAPRSLRSPPPPLRAPQGYDHTAHVGEHSEGSLFFEAGPIGAAGGPEQLSLALGATPDVMVVSWLTNGTGAQSIVRFGTSSGVLTQTATGAAGVAYKCGGYTSGAIHMVSLTGLSPATRYYYEVGAAGAGSSERSFVSSPGIGAIYPYTLGAIGDLGQTANSAATVAHILASSASSTFITGDLSYADSDQPRWDSYQRLVENLSSSMPYMVASGNHVRRRREPPDAPRIRQSASPNARPPARPPARPATRTPFSLPQEIEACLPNVYEAYAARYASMPSKGSPDGPLYYSYEVGPAHVIVLASFFTFTQGSPQYAFLQKDLAAIDRSKTPWVITLIHAPWYNSNKVSLPHPS